jgi:hypothetical protein
MTCYAILIKAETVEDANDKLTFAYADGGPFVEVKRTDVINVLDSVPDDDFTKHQFQKLCTSLRQRGAKT